MSTEIHVAGLAQLQQALDELSGKMQMNIMRGALRAGVKVIQTQAKAICPVEGAGVLSPDKSSLGWSPGALQRSIKISAKLSKGQVWAKVKAGDKKAFYAHMVEFGTAAHWIRPKNRKSLSFGGAMRADVYHPGSRKIPFMRVAMDGQAQPALVAVGDYIRSRLTKEGIDIPDAGDPPQ